MSDEWFPVVVFLGGLGLMTVAFLISGLVY